MKKGFTLVELSIVLVVIGLLIGGILVGQNLIESTRIVRAIGEITQYQVLINDFKQKYRFLPGDSSGRGFSTSCVPFDGLLTYGGANPPCLGNDIGNMWRDLHLAGYLDYAYTGGFTNGLYGGLYPAEGKLPILQAFKASGNTDILFNITQSGGGSFSISGTVYGKSAANILTFTNSSDGRGGLKPSRAIAIDKKIDDNSPSSGDIFTVKHRYDAGTLCATGDSNSAATAVEWSVGDDSYEGCRMLIWFDRFIN